MTPFPSSNSTPSLLNLILEFQLGLCYLDLKLKITDAKALKDRLLDTCSKLDMKAMADEVAPFLLSNSDTKKITLFEQYLKQVEL